MKQGYDAYKTANIDTADQGRLIIIAYDIAIKSCKLALEKFDDRHLLEERTKHIFKAQDAITELLTALKLDVGDIAKNLYNLYDYMLRCLVEASVKHKKEKITEVLGYMESLREAWVVAIQKTKTNNTSDLKLESMAV
jgi:flagellar protein FliS